MGRRKQRRSAGRKSILEMGRKPQRAAEDSIRFDEDLWAALQPSDLYVKGGEHLHILWETS